MAQLRPIFSHAFYLEEVSPRTTQKKSLPGVCVPPPATFPAPPHSSQPSTPVWIEIPSSVVRYDVEADPLELGMTSSMERQVAATPAALRVFEREARFTDMGLIDAKRNWERHHLRCGRRNVRGERIVKVGVPLSIEYLDRNGKQRRWKETMRDLERWAYQIRTKSPCRGRSRRSCVRDSEGKIRKVQWSVKSKTAIAYEERCWRDATDRAMRVAEECEKEAQDRKVEEKIEKTTESKTRLEKRIASLKVKGWDSDGNDEHQEKLEELGEELQECVDLLETCYEMIEERRQEILERKEASQGQPAQQKLERNGAVGKTPLSEKKSFTRVDSLLD